MGLENTVPSVEYKPCAAGVTWWYMPSYGRSAPCTETSSYGCRYPSVEPASRMRSSLIIAAYTIDCTSSSMNIMQLSFFSRSPTANTMQSRSRSAKRSFPSYCTPKLSSFGFSPVPFSKVAVFLVMITKLPTPYISTQGSIWGLLQAAVRAVSLSHSGAL